jgi:hypothetical protein
MAKKPISKTATVRKYCLANPAASSAFIAKLFDVKSSYVSTIRWQLKKKPKQNVDKFSKLVHQVTKGPIKPLIMEYTPPADPVNHPEHYKAGGIETIDFIEAKGLGYHLGNVVKYISRAGKKGTNQGLEDLKKAQWYLNRAIEKNEYASPNR